ncbi:MAG TPA: hypothetical protein VKB78_01580, partial [Pirellulales bacterium]|nr:hypothetical protein [Pirellulales bacterium]
PIDGGQAGVEPPASLDPETAALRRTWQQLSKLLDAGAPSDRPIEIQSALGRFLVSAEPIATHGEFVVHEKRDQKHRRFRWSAVVVAASLLVAIGLVVTLKIIEGLKSGRGIPPTNSIAHGDDKTQSNQANRNNQPAQTSDRNLNVAANETGADSWQWNDSVDDDITAVARAAALVKQDWYAKSGAIGAVETGVGDLSRELDQGPL